MQDTNDLGSAEVICKGFSLPQEEADYLRSQIDKLIEESPCDSNLVLTIEKRNELYHCSISIQAEVAIFDVDHRDSSLTHLLKEIFKQTFAKLNSWKKERDFEDIKVAA